MFAYAHISLKSKEGLYRLEEKVRTYNYFAQVMLFYLVTISFAFLGSLLLQQTSLDMGDAELSPLTQMIGGLIVAPLVETLINQKLVYWLLNRISFFRGRKWLIICISAILFGGLHCYNLGYMIWASFLGVVLMYIYMYYQPDDKRAFRTTALIHFLLNLTVLVSNNI